MSPRTTRRLLLIAATAAALLAAPGIAQAAPTTWDGGGDGVTWSDAANWAPDGVPTAGSVLIPEEDPRSPGSDLYVTLDTYEFVSTITVQGVLLVEHTLDVAGSIVVDGGALQLGGGAGAANVYGDTLDVRGSGSFADGGYVSGTGTVTATVVVGDHGFVHPDPSSSGPSLVFDSTLRIEAGGTFLLRLASATSYGRYGGINVSDGQIVVVPENGYSPAAGDRFEVGYLDPFASVDSRQVGSGRYLVQSKETSSMLVLTTVQSAIAASEGAYVGSSLTVTGSNFVPGEAISVDVFSGTSMARAQATASATGAFSVDVPITAGFEPGPVTVDAYGSSSSTQTRTTGTLVAVPTPTPPTPPTTPTPPSTPDACADGSGRWTARIGAAVIVGCPGNDWFSGGPGDDRFTGGAGNDRAYGGDDDDVLRGGLDDDVVLGGRGNDRAFGDDGTDQLFGQDGDDRLLGGTGGDVVSGGPGNDVVRGGTGADRILCGSGIDVATGDNGTDLIGCRDRAPGDTLAGGNGFDVCIGDVGDRFLRCETVIRLA